MASVWLSGRVVIDGSDDGMQVLVAVGEVGGETTLDEKVTDLEGRFELNAHGSAPHPPFLELRLYGPDQRNPGPLIHRVAIAPGFNLKIAVPAEDFERAGRATQLELSIKRLRFANCQVDLSPRSMTFFVGPNGSGKTRALSEIRQATDWAPRRRRPLIVFETHLDPSRADPALIRNWIRREYGVGTDGTAEFANASMPLGRVSRDEPTLGLLMLSLGIEDRFALSHYQDLAAIDQPPANLVDYVLRDGRRLQSLSAAVYDAFGKYLLPDFGPQVGFRVADTDQLPADRTSGDYRRALLEFSPLAEAGDGLRSFVGTMIALVGCPHPILLIDEPEAFLHPPQARALGRRLAVESQRRQILVATHSADLVAGAIAARMHIVRLDRRGEATRFNFVDPESVARLASHQDWESTELLASMFHTGAVLCEADADRRLYRALSDGSDVSFVACGGKGPMARRITSLLKLGVPCAAIADFDILGRDGELRAVIDALAGSSAQILGEATRYDELHKAIVAVAARTLRELRDGIDAIQADQSLDRSSLLDAVSELAASARAGADAKRRGLEALDDDLRRACEDLLGKLETIGLFVVPSGELESWCPIPVKKGRWTIEVLRLLCVDPSRFDPARAFVRRVLSYLGEPVDRLPGQVT